MSNEHEGPSWHMANLIPRKYNYWTNPDFQTVHYYNGNSFRSSPLPTPGANSASNRSRGDRGACTRLCSRKTGETSRIGEDSSGRNGKSVFLSAPWIRGAIAG
jgi:hypothetical protein